jgi:hypothetical protein
LSLAALRAARVNLYGRRGRAAGGQATPAASFLLFRAQPFGRAVLGRLGRVLSRPNMWFV